MTKHVDDLSKQDFIDLLGAIGSRGVWQWDTDFVNASLQEVAKKAVAGSHEAETRFQHELTNAVLYVRVPALDTPPKALKALLEQPFDPKLDENSCFAQELGQAHAVLASERLNRYISSIQTAHTVLSITVPLQYELERLAEAALLADRTAQRIQSFHQEIKAPVHTIVD